MRPIKTVVCLAVIGMALVAQDARATIITYSGILISGVTATGSITQPAGSPSEPVDATYYSFSAASGDSIEVYGDRLDGGYDMSMWVMSGLYGDTDDFGGSFPGPAAFAIFGDDDDAPNVPGPFGDPHVFFIAPITGMYTVAVTNFASGGAGPFGFELTMNLSSVPEPGTFGLLAAFSIPIGLVIRRNRRRK